MLLPLLLKPCLADPQPAPAIPEGVEIQVIGADLTLFPLPGAPAPILIRARKFLDTPVSLKCRAVIDTVNPLAPPGYECPDRPPLSLDAAGVWHEAVMRVCALPGQSAMATGKLVVRGAAGDAPVRLDVPLRMGRGALAFMERRPVPTHAGTQDTDIVCLETSGVRAEVNPVHGCLCTLKTPQTRTDALVTGDAPFGLVWAGLSGWYQTAMPAPGESVCARFSTRSAGARVEMAATAEETGDEIKVAWDATDLQAPPGPIYLMVTATVGEQDTVWLPSASGTRELPLDGGAERTERGAPAGGTLRLRLQGCGAELLLSYQAPTLNALRVGSCAPWYHYVGFDLAPDASPGEISFQVSLRPAP